MRKNVILLGNGINDVVNSYKWKDLINDLILYLDLKDMHVDDKKSFPLFYEEMYLTNLKTKRVLESNIKSFIAEKVKIFRPIDLHERITSLGLSDILTTNYDMVIENSKSNQILSNMGIVKESLYSVFRYMTIGKTKVWHIHGEVNFPNSILLGYEHYSGQLQHIRNYVVSGTGNEYRNKNFTALIKLIKDGKVENNSWLDLFFTSNIYIVGLSLDFSETDLWWLLTYRARKKLEGKSLINNSITYYYPKEYEKSSQSKLEMLVADQIIVKPIGLKHGINYYEKVLDDIKLALS
jgi:hypothetical protein